jgi:hypothetical protein
MSIIVTRAGKGSPLTNNEVDSNLHLLTVLFLLQVQDRLVI